MGPARVHLDGEPRLPVLLLGHGAGGGPDAPDLLAARTAALAVGWAVGRVEQPYRVGGRRVAEPAARLDIAWTDICQELRAELGPAALVTGGRSSGARVACRTAAQVDAAAVLCLAFPLLPPGRGSGRGGELAQPEVPRLVVQGSRDAFGIPEPGPGVAVHVVEGADHSFAVRKKDGRAAAEVRTEVRDVVTAWLQTLTGTAALT